MELRKNEQGFTFASHLFVIMVLGMILPIIAYLYQATASIPSNTEEISIQQFFQFLRDDLSKATSYHVAEEQLTIHLYDGTPTTIEKYFSVIRRQVEGKGHEIYLHHVKDVKFEEMSHGIKTTITSSKGNEYVKHIVYYP